MTHGTISTYTNRHCRCERCRAAWAAHQAVYMAAYQKRPEVKARRAAGDRISAVATMPIRRPLRRRGSPSMPATARNAEMVRLVTDERLTLAQVGARYGVSRQRVSQILLRASVHASTLRPPPQDTATRSQRYRARHREHLREYARERYQTDPAYRERKREYQREHRARKRSMSGSTEPTVARPVAPALADLFHLEQLRGLGGGHKRADN